MRDRCVEGTCNCMPRKPKPQSKNPEPLIPAPRKVANSRPQILMTIKDRNVTIFECNAKGCKWSRLSLGGAISGEREALEHLKTHDKQAD